MPHGFRPNEKILVAMDFNAKVREVLRINIEKKIVMELAKKRQKGRCNKERKQYIGKTHGK